MKVVANGRPLGHERQAVQELEAKISGLEDLPRDIDRGLQTLRNDLTVELRRLNDTISAFTKDRTWRERAREWLYSLRGAKGWLKLGAFAFGAISLVSAWCSLLPKVSLLLGPIQDGGYVFRSSVLVFNESTFGLTDASIGCRFGELRGSELPAPPPDYWRTTNYTFSGQIKYSRYMSSFIGAGNKASVDSFCPIDGKLSYVDVVLVVHYRYFGVPGQKFFRLTTIKRPNGSMEWLEEPYEEGRKTRVL